MDQPSNSTLPRAALPCPARKTPPQRTRCCLTTYGSAAGAHRSPVMTSRLCAGPLQPLVRQRAIQVLRLLSLIKLDHRLEGNRSERIECVIEDLVEHFVVTRSDAEADDDVLFSAPFPMGLLAGG